MVEWVGSSLMDEINSPNPEHYVSLMLGKAESLFFEVFFFFEARFVMKKKRVKEEQWMSYVVALYLRTLLKERERDATFTA